MKKQLLNKILLIVVLAIWGYIIYTFFFKKKNTVNTYEYTTQNYEIPAANISKDTFEFKKLDRDPFLGRIKAPVRRIIKKKIVKAPVKTYYRWPKIEYKGFIKKQSQETPSVLLRVNGKLKKLHIDELILNEIKIEKIEKKYIELSCKGNVKTIKR